MSERTPGGWTDEQRRKQNELSDRLRRPATPADAKKDGKK